MDMGKGYVAGPMRGIDQFNFPAFASASEALRAEGWEIVSPAEMDLGLGLDPKKYPELPDWFTLHDAMRRDLAAICTCDTIFLLPGWEKSEGTRREMQVAAFCGLDARALEHRGIGVWTHEPLPGWPDVLAPPTPQSGEVRITNPTTGGEKGQKLARYDLIPANPLRQLAEHYGKGARKYSERNWERGYDWSLNFAALMRHAWAWWDREDVDEETGSNHMVAVVWHAFALLEFHNTHPELDDRPGRTA